jgi:hypothetical protein
MMHSPRERVRAEPLRARLPVPHLEISPAFVVGVVVGVAVGRRGDLGEVDGAEHGQVAVDVALGYEVHQVRHGLALEVRR